MKCEFCKCEYSDSVYPLHVERCKVPEIEEPPTKPESDPDMPPTDENLLTEEESGAEEPMIESGDRSEPAPEQELAPVVPEIGIPKKQRPIIVNDEVVTLLQIEGTAEQYELIDLVIPEIEGDFKRIRNKDFDVDENLETVYPEGSKLTAALMIGYILNKQYGIQSQSISKYSQTNEATIQGYPKSITDRIQKFIKYV